MNYNGIKVDWTDGEWERLQEIKANRVYEEPLDTKMGFTLSASLRERIKEYAAARDITPSELMRHVLNVVVK